MIEGDASRLRILYVQAIELDSDLCRTSRLGLSVALAERGCHVTLVAGFRRQRPDAPRGVELALIRLLKTPYARALCYSVAAHGTVFLLLARRRFDVVIVDPYTFHCGWPFDWLARVGLIRTRFVLDVRSGIFHRRARPRADTLRRRLMQLAFGYTRTVFSGFTTISPMLRDVLASEYQIPRERIGVWESAVSMDFATRSADAPLHPAGETHQFVVLYHGSFGADRGLPETVEAMRLVGSRRPEVLLLLLGGGTEEPHLRRLAQGLENVKFVPTVPHEQVPAFIGRCSVGILPFRPTMVMRSSRPLKLVEYLALGKPVIVSRIEAFTTVVTNGGAVYLRDQTPEAIADAIVAAYDQIEQLTEAARVAQATVAFRFTWPQEAETLCKFLTALP